MLNVGLVANRCRAHANAASSQSWERPAQAPDSAIGSRGGRGVLSGKLVKKTTWKGRRCFLAGGMYVQAGLDFI